MNEKSYFENYMHYQLPQCFKQVADDSQIHYSYNNLSISDTLSPDPNFVDVCNISSQNFALHQNPISAQPGQSDLPLWENRIMPDVEKTMKICDKLEMIEISGKDLSPSTYSSHIDLIISESYKQSTSKDANNFNKFENEWYYGQGSSSHKNAEFTSCAQEKPTRHCMVQKHQNMDLMIRNCSYSDAFYENSISYRTPNKNELNETSEYMYNYYDDKFIGNQSCIQNVNYFNTNISAPFTSLIKAIDQQTEGSNEESDIIVEESDEEVTDYIEDNETQLFCQINKCLICNIIYKPQGTQFYFLTTENPLTMCSQKPVIQTLINILGQIPTTGNYLCSECLELINNVDHLHLKLEKCKMDLVTKFKTTCVENKIHYREKPPHAKQKKPGFNKLPKFKCKLCNKILCLRRYCHYHLKRHKDRGYLCDVCGRVYSNKEKFTLHYIQHKQRFCRKIDCFKCSNCDKKFRTKSNQKEHENYCLGVLPFACKNQYCDKKFPSTTKLKSHVKLKHDKKFVVICSICNIGFIKMSDYKNHIVSHSAVKKYSCQKCCKNYKTLSNLNFHMKVHSNNLPFSCHICKKGFMRKEYLEAHINNHNGIKNFGCTICEKKFVSQKNLDAHLKYHEGTVKKSTCNICGKTMTSGFEEHLRIHNNLKEFECEQCNMKFNTKGTLSKHVKKKH